MLMNSNSLHSLRFGLAGLLAVALVACGETAGNTGADSAGPDATTGDIAFEDLIPTTDVQFPDALADANPDADSGDLVPDASVPDGDAEPDTTPDTVQPDAVADVAPDAAPDVAVDAVADVTPDAVADVTPDAVPDAVADVTPDAVPDAVADVTPDAVADAVPDATPDATPDADAACVPACGEPILGLTLECGDDGCGGQCGICDSGETCNGGFCEGPGVIPTSCDEAHGLVGCCADGDLFYFDEGALQGAVGDCAGTGCGWDAAGGFYDCGLVGPDPSGTFPLACGGANPAPESCPVCSCEGVECGDDGCGASCGTCDDPDVCSTNGQCVASDVLQCVVKPECSEADPCDCAACADDGECTFDDDCVCADCAADEFCSAPTSCNADGICDLFNEGCACADCGPHPLCCAVGVCESSAIFNGATCVRDYSDPGTACDDGNAETSSDVCDGTGGCAGVVVSGSEPKLIINELDYDMSGIDETEFLEVYNPGPGAATLSRWKLQHVNGSDAAVLWTRNLSEGGATLAAGAYLVFGSPSIIAGLPLGVQSVDIGTVAFQNGGPDGVRLMLDGAFASGLSYEGKMVGTGEGNGAPEDTAANSLQRCPNGADTHDNSVDFVLRPPSPGVVNPCPPAACAPEPGFVPATCDEAHGLVGCCAGGTVYWYELGMLQPIAGGACGVEGCGWDSAQGFYACGNDGVADPSGIYPITCGCENPSPETCP
jgi:hypothetical protein